MSEVEPDKFRISDAERQTALDALGEHLSSGRLDVEEYGERTARVTTAKTRGELTEVFADLPEPRPQFGGPPAPTPAPAPAPASRPPDEVARKPSTGSALERTFSAMVPLSAIIALVLFMTLVKTWVIFLLPVAVVIIGGAVLGDDWKNNRRGHRGRRGPRGHWHHY